MQTNLMKPRSVGFAESTEIRIGLAISEGELGILLALCTENRRSEFLKY
jgi:hypothetical protein